MALHPPPVERHDGAETEPRSATTPVDLADRRPPPLRSLLERLADSRVSQLDLPSLRSLPSRRLLGLAALVMLVVVGAWLVLRRPRAVAVENLLPQASTSAVAAAPTSPPVGAAASSGSSATGAASNATVVVHVAGAVRSPGLRTLSGTPRVADAVAAAGGAASDADLDRLNLAAPLADGERVYVPRRGETTEPQVIGPSGAGASDDGADAGPVDLNTATADQLDGLPGVGPATAAAIISYRDQHGGFTSVDDLEEVRGIGDARMEQLRPLVTVGS